MRRPEAPAHCMHPLRFETHRDAQLEMLIQRFQGGLDYRDSLDAHEPPPAANKQGIDERPGVVESVRQSPDAKARSS